MAVRCAKCGEELLGAVNRCWKCGQVFVRHPEMDGLPPVRMERSPEASEPLEAIVLDDATAGSPAAPAAVAAASPVAIAQVAPAVQFLPKRAAPPPSTAEIVEARRQSMMAMGGTVGALLLGIFSLILSPFRVEGAVVALFGLGMGLWGLYSTRRNWALVGLLLCCLGIVLGAYRGANDLYILIKKNQPVEVDEPFAEEDTAAP
jgi:hypothetical protein